MATISVSIPEEMASELARRQQIMGTGRTEAVRVGIREIPRRKKQLDGKNSAVLMVTHNDIYDRVVADIKEEYGDLIKTHTQQDRHRPARGSLCSGGILPRDQVGDQHLPGQQKDGERGSCDLVEAFEFV